MLGRYAVVIADYALMAGMFAGVDGGHGAGVWRAVDLSADV